MFVLSCHRYIIQFVNFHTPEDEWKGYMYAAVLFLVAVIQSVCVHQFFIKCMVVGMRLRTAVMSIVYKKVGHGWEGLTHPLACTALPHTSHLISSGCLCLSLYP